MLFFAQNQRPGDVFSQFDNFFCRKRSLSQYLLQRGQQLHTDKDIASDSICMRDYGKIVTTDDIGLALQLFHQFVFLHIILNFFFIRSHNTCLIISVIVIRFYFVGIFRSGNDFDCGSFLNS